MSSTVIVLEELLMQHIFGVIRTVFVTLATLCILVQVVYIYIIIS